MDATCVWPFIAVASSRLNCTWNFSFAHFLYCVSVYYWKLRVSCLPLLHNTFHCEYEQANLIVSTPRETNITSVLIEFIVEKAGNVCINVDIEAHSCNNYCRGKSISISNIFWICVCSLSYPACKVREPYCHVWPVRPYSMSTSHKRHDFRGEKLSNIKCVLWFSLQLLSQTFLILRETSRDIIKNV